MKQKLIIILISVCLAASVACKSKTPTSDTGTNHDSSNVNQDSSVDVSDLGNDLVSDVATDLNEDSDATPDAGVPQTFYWVDWASGTAGLPGNAAGSIIAPSGTVTVTYSGEITFVQTAGGTNYWNPGEPYENSVTANAPPESDIIGLTGQSATNINTITFSPPVKGLVMAVVSLGSPSANVKYTFNTPFKILSYGKGYWGEGELTSSASNELSGTEGHGAVQFQGTVSQLTWTISASEYWHGFTIGIPNQ